jgi:hypothetical protein
MSSQKEAMDVNVSTSMRSTSTMDLMKLIDDANCTTTVPDLEQWTVRGWPNGMAMLSRERKQRIERK